MHTTGTTTPEGVHTLAPGLGQRRPMAPPSGGHFKLPEAVAQVLGVDHPAAAAVAAVVAPAAPPQAAAPAPTSSPEPRPGLPPEYNQTALRQAPGAWGAPGAPASVAPVTAPPVASVPAPTGLGALAPTALPLPPAPWGYQSAPAHVPAGMLAVPLHPAGTFTPEAPPASGVFKGPAQVHYTADEAQWAPPRPPQQAAAQVAAQQPVGQPAGRTVRLSGDPGQLEAALGVLIMRGVGVELLG